MLRRSLLIILLAFSGCGHSHHHSQDKPEDKRKDETDLERAARLRREAAIAKKQAADKERFDKSVAIIRTVQPGDEYSDFYHKASEARLSLENVTKTEDGRDERYAFADSSTAFVTVVVKAEHIREIRIEDTGK
jgi:hypothetical protein